MLKQSFLTIVVGQNVVLREGLVSVLRAADFSVLDAVCSVSDVDMNIRVQQQLSILLIVTAGDDPSVVFEEMELLKDIRRNGSVVVVADRFRLNDVISAFQHGTKAYFFKHARSDVLIKCLELVMMGETLVPAEMLSFLFGHKDDDYPEETQRMNGSTRMITEDNHVYKNRELTLSDREKTVLQCLIIGDSNKTIARKINIAEATVKVYIKTILRKIHVKNRTQAAIWAMRNASIAPAVDDAVADAQRERFSSKPRRGINPVKLVCDCPAESAPEEI